MGFLSWIGDLVELFISFVPHLDNMKANHAGIKFKRGGKVQEIKPGLYWYWPIVTEVQELPTKRQTMRLDTQTLTTTDDQTIATSAVVVYEINNIRKAIVDTWDIEETIGDAAQYAVVQAITSRSFEEARAAMTGAIPDELKKQCAKDLRQFGVAVKDAFLSDLTFTTAYRVMGDGPAMIPNNE